MLIQKHAIMEHLGGVQRVKTQSTPLSSCLPLCFSLFIIHCWCTYIQGTDCLGTERTTLLLKDAQDSAGEKV